jgi:hypothetical protein
MTQNCLYHRQTSRVTVALIILLSIALGLRIGLAIFLPNVFHPDEIFQTLEPAHRLVYGYGVTTWEWRSGIRSWVLPSFLAGVMRSTGWMGSGASGYTCGVIVVLSLLSLSTVWFGFAWAKRVSGMEAAIVAAGACSIFFDLVYFAPKALNEVVATHVLLPGLYLGTDKAASGERNRLFFAGMLCGLAASLRIQLIPAVAFAAIYFCYPSWRRRAPAIAIGLLVPILLFGLADRITLRYPWQSFVSYFKANTIDGRSLLYGVEPWYWYVPVLVTLLGPTILFVWKGARRSPFLAILSCIILISHSLIAHKEIRFLYTILPLAITLAAIGFVDSAANLSSFMRLRGSSKIIITLGLLFFAISSALVASLYSNWCRASGAQVAFDHLSRDPTLCGVAFYEVNWWNTGGYTHLHRNVPIIVVSDASGVVKDAPTFNALGAPFDISGIPADFHQTGCWNGVCLHQRTGACRAPQPDNTLDGLLRRTGN